MSDTNVLAEKKVDVVSQKDAKTGRFLAGNNCSVGRPKGSRNKLTTEFFDDFYVAWRQYGASALKKVAVSNPKDFVKAAAMLMPKEFEIKSPLNELTDAELTELIAAVQSIIAAAAPFEPASRERAATKPQ